MTMIDLWIALPLLLIALGALLTLLLGAVMDDDRVGTLVGVAAALGAALWLLQTPPAIVAPTLGLSAAPLARTFGIAFSLLAAAVLCLSFAYNRARSIRGEEPPATILFTAFGMLALSASTNLLTLFLGLEAMSFGFYLLVAIDLQRPTSGETGLKYLLPGALSAAFLAFGLALLYSVSGTLSLPVVVQATLGTAPNPVALAGWGCLLAGIAFKLSLVPAHLWTPDVYLGAPAPISAFLSAGSKGAAILFLLLLLSAAPDPARLRLPLAGLALLSLVVGNLAALRQSRVRRLLAYSSIAQMGYVVLALIAGRSGGYVAAAYYALVYGVISLAAFGAIVVIERNGGGERIEDYRGLGQAQPFAGAVLTLALFALAGIPPTAGFIGKFLIFTAALRSGEIALAMIGILLAAISIYYYLRVVVILYFKEAPPRESARPHPLEYLVLTVSALAILFLGLWPGALLNLLVPLFP